MRRPNWLSYSEKRLSFGELSQIQPHLTDGQSESAWILTCWPLVADAFSRIP